MKNRIDICFENLKAENKKALVTFITAGDPDMETTEKNVLAMAENGADIIEIGVPFSDPIAEGSTIQKASLRALEHHTNLDEIFEMVKRLREKTDKPLLLMMYLNTLFKYGKEKFFKNCTDSQIDGIIVPDMPFEERDEISDIADKYGIYNILLAAPTSHERIKTIAEAGKGFLYIVSSLGVTGVRKEITTDFNKLLEPIKNGSYCPACIGFGISDGKAAKNMAQYCDGAIMGSAFVKIAEKYGKDAPKYIGDFTAQVKKDME